MLTAFRNWCRRKCCCECCCEQCKPDQGLDSSKAQVPGAPRLLPRTLVDNEDPPSRSQLFEPRGKDEKPFKEIKIQVRQKA